MHSWCYDVSQLSTRALFSYSPTSWGKSGFKIYLGLQFSEDGWTFIIGAKLAGVKLILPWSGIQNFYQLLTKNEPSEIECPNEEEHMFRHLTLGLGFAAITYFCQS